MTAATVVRTDDVPSGDRLDLWRHAACDTIVPLQMSAADDTDYLGTLAAHDLGAAQLVDMTAAPIHVARTPRLIRASDPGLYKIELHLRGASSVDQGDRDMLLGTGQATIVDTSRPYAMAAGGPGATVRHPVSALPRLLTLMLPHALLPVSPDRVADVTAVELGRALPTGALVTATLAQMARSAAAGDDFTAARLVPVLADLLAVGLAGLHDRAATLSVECRQRALLARVQAFIRDNLADPELSPTTIAAAHHVSPRSLHQLFADHAATTVAAHIRNSRLERCRRELTDPARRDRPVAAIAATWGFTSLAHFTRVFRTAYGLPPATYRQLHTPAALPI